MINAVRSCNGVLKNGQLRRKKGKQKKAKGNQSEQDNRQGRELIKGKIFFKKKVFYEIGSSDGNKEEEDVQPVGRFSESTICRVKKYGDKKKPRNDSNKLYPPKAFILLVKKDALHDGKEERRETEKLHMLPSRFVHGSKEGNKGIFFCPLVEEVQYRT